MQATIQRPDIDQLLTCGEKIGSHRELASAKDLLAEFKTRLATYTAQPGFQDKVAVEYIQEVILTAAWYAHAIRKARILRGIYVGVYIVLLVGIPAGLCLLGNQLLAETAPQQRGVPVVTQVVLGLTSIVALQQMGNVIMDAHQRFGIWWKTASALKTIWYATLSTWSDTAPTASGKTVEDFLLDLKISVAKARALVADEQQDFFDNLAKPFPDVLNILSSTTKAVKGLVTDVLPEAEGVATNASAAIRARREIARQEAISEQLDVLIDAARARLQQATTEAEKTAAGQELGRWTALKETAVSARIAAAGELAASAR